MVSLVSVHVPFSSVRWPAVDATGERRERVMGNQPWSSLDFPLRSTGDLPVRLRCLDNRVRDDAHGMI